MEARTDQRTAELSLPCFWGAWGKENEKLVPLFSRIYAAS